MTKIFSSGGPNFPKDEDDLKNRLAKIAEGLPDQRDNINPFVIPAFELFRDCGLITKENIEILQKQYLRWMDIDENKLPVIVDTRMNPLGGVLREKGLTMCDGSNLRYYCPEDELIISSDIELWAKLDAKRRNYGGKSKLAVICENTTYYISNDWYSPGKTNPTKPAFFSWLMFEVIGICNKKWEDDEKNTQTTGTVSVKPEVEKAPSENNSETEKLLKTLISLVARLDGRVDNLEKTLSKIEKDIDELKNEWYGK